MALPSRSLSVPVWLSLRLRKEEPATVFSATVADVSAIAGALSLILVTAIVIVAVSEFVPSEA